MICSAGTMLSGVATSRATANIFFFFQAEDGIRDRDVTGVQTCALPILLIVFISELSAW